MSHCKICLNKRSNYVLNNQLVCMRCDELLFDLEIELEEAPSPLDGAKPKNPTLERQRVLRSKLGKQR